jgi:hypothetical protein
VIDVPAGIKKRNGFGGATGGGSKQDWAVFLIQYSTGVFDAGEEGTKYGAWPAAKFLRVWKNEEITDSPLGYSHGEVSFTGERKFGKILQIPEVRWTNAKALKLSAVMDAVGEDLVADKGSKSFVLQGTGLIGRPFAPHGMVGNIHD